MRDREKELVWNIGSGTFFSHSEELESGLHSLSIQRLDALLYTSHSGEIQSRLRYGICFWGVSSGAADVFTCQKRIVRSMEGMNSTVLQLRN
ncbi:hypothetical protein WA026_003597 [Henosepilachna vigintioctopunctata]|uniref:Uncharacterized protein n=1 Tax=Henosepilachna vigintioctopunctata TaxID=420089 RepID=A0AAW1TJB3_9CUCU